MEIKNSRAYHCLSVHCNVGTALMLKVEVTVLQTGRTSRDD